MAPAGLLGDQGRARGAVTEGLVRVILAVRQEIERLEARIAEQLALHPDAAIFCSLPRSWAGAIWRCWQDRVPYDPERHGALQRLVAVEG